MRKKIISILLITIALITSVVFTGCGDKKETKQEETQAYQMPFSEPEVETNPAKIISDENASQSIKNYDINSNIIKYKETDLKLEISYKEEKIIYNKNNVIITFNSLKENDIDEVGQYINITIENKSKDNLNFKSNSIIVNDTMVIPCNLSESIPASSKVNTSAIIYPETLYENHINNINNLSFLIKLDFNDYKKIREEEGDWTIIKLSKYSDKIFRDVTKVINFGTNSIKPFKEPKGELLFSNDVMDVIFEGFIDNQVDNSRSDNYQKGFFKIINKSNEYLKINAHDFVLDKDPSIEYSINSDGCFIPPNKISYCFFQPTMFDDNVKGIINELKKHNSLGFTFDVSQDLTDEEVTSFDFIINFKK